MRIEHASVDAGHEAAVAEWHASYAAAQRLGVGVVERDENGEWRAAARWQGSREKTEIEDRKLRREWATRALPARPAKGCDADRARRLRLAEATIEPLALDRRETHPFFLGFGPPR
jgi:hypothetical protein